MNTTGRVVLVDNEESSLREAREILEQAGYACYATPDPREAYEKVRRKPKKVDLIVTDFVMDPITGLDLVRMLRQDLIGIPVILVSADIHSGVREGAAKLGIEHLLRKPLERQPFLEAVTDLLGTRAGEMEPPEDSGLA